MDPHDVRTAVSGRWLAAAWSLAVGTCALVIAAGRPAPALTLDAPDGVFSGTRALATLERLIPPGPHPVGSAANRELRERIEEEFERLGLATQLQARLACNDKGVCGPVENVLARFPGFDGDAHPKPGILLVAHYDSVPAGPGAGDDLSGVACLLEIARVLAAQSEPGRERVSFLITDGEEIGLLGAHAFVDHNPWLARIDAVINLEARGSSGPSLLFETGAGNAWLMELYAGSALRPAATSYSVEVYRRMPNDTDFSPFRDAGLAGLNFAFIEDSHNYHTANDALERLDPRSLQHHGDNVLPLVRAYCRTEEPRARGDLVYFDVFGRGMLRWHTRWNRVFLIFEALLLCVGVVRARRVADVRWTRVLGMALVALGVWVLAALAGTATGLLLGLRPGPVGAMHPIPVWIAYLSTTLLALTLAGRFGRSSLESFLGLGVLWLAAAVLSAWAAPGAAHLFIVPLAAVVLGLSIPRIQRGLDGAWGMSLALLVTFVSASLWSPLLHGLAQAFGLGAGGLLVAVMAASAPWLVPVARAVSSRARSRALFAAGLLLALTSASALIQERVSAEVPAHVTFYHVVDTDEGTASIITDSGLRNLPPALGDTFSGEPESVWWGMLMGPSVPAQVLVYAPPELEMFDVEESEGGRTAHVILRSPGGADRTWLRFPPGVLVEARIVIQDGEQIQVPMPDDVLLLVAPPSEGLELTLVLSSRKPVTIAVVDQYLRTSPDVQRLRDTCGPEYLPRRSGDTILIGARLAL